MSNQLMEFKESLINSGLFKRTPSNPSQYRCQTCPFCGDTRGKMYVSINLSNDDPVLYHCFICNASGVMNKEFLEYFDLGDSIMIPKQSYRKKLDVSQVSTIVNQVSCNEQDDLTNVSSYIQSRVDVIPTLQELQTFQYVGNPFQYTKEYLEPEIQSDYYLKRRAWFKLTNGNMIGRTYNDSDKMRWLRYHTKNCTGKGLYTMKEPLDLYRPINILIAEGVMDVIGLYYHYPIPNSFHIAVLGKEYQQGIQHVLNMGIFGSSIHIKIFKDADVDLNRIRIHSNLVKLFKSIEIYQNAIDHDYGVSSDHVEIVKLSKL